MKLIFERSRPGRGNGLLPSLDVPAAPLPEKYRRKTAPRLPELGESDLSRHYQALARRAFGVCDGFYPLGSCTMKYNPKLGEEAAALLESPNNILGIEYCKALLGQNAPLRAVVNGRVMGVSEDFYDPVLRRCLTEKPQKVANVLGQALVQLSGVGDWLLARRLRAMAEAGAVRVDEAGSTRGFYGAAVCLA